MSFFSDTVVIGDTSTPSNYETSGTIDPNASQYGWTKSDQAHYNQLIAYVNDARRYFEHSLVIGEFVKEAMSELVRIENLTIYLNETKDAVDRDAAQIREDTDRAIICNTEVSTMHKLVTMALEEITRLHSEIVVIGQTAEAAAAATRIDATNAGDYYLRTKTMYDEWKATQP